MRYCWALRDKTTMLFLPWGQHYRNNSWEEFTSTDKPRLFNTKRAAINARTAWGLGRWRWVNSGGYFDPPENSLEPTAGKRTQHRDTKNVELVCFGLIEQLVR